MDQGCMLYWGQAERASLPLGQGAADNHNESLRVTGEETSCFFEVWINGVESEFVPTLWLAVRSDRHQSSAAAAKRVITSPCYLIRILPHINICPSFYLDPGAHDKLTPVVFMLGHRRRQWPNIKTTLSRRFVFSGSLMMTHCDKWRSLLALCMLHRQSHKLTLLFSENRRPGLMLGQRRGRWANITPVISPKTR